MYVCGDLHVISKPIVFVWGTIPRQWILDSWLLYQWHEESNTCLL